MTTLQKMLEALDNRELEEALVIINKRFGRSNPSFTMERETWEREQRAWEREQRAWEKGGEELRKEIDSLRQARDTSDAVRMNFEYGSLEHFQAFLERLDAVKAINPDKENTNRGYTLRFFILLSLIAREPGRIQSYYTDELKWTKQNTNIHVSSLKEGGFIKYEEAQGVSYKNKPPKALFLTDGGKEVIWQLLDSFDPERNSLSF